jgi:hypothetical protein
MHHGGEIARGMMEVEIVKPRMLLAASSRVINFNDRVYPSHVRHQKADALMPSISCKQQVYGPGNGDILLDGQQVIGRMGKHNHELARAIVGRLVIDLCYQRRLLWNCIDTCLTPSAEGEGWIEGNKLPIGLTLQPHG